MEWEVNWEVSAEGKEKTTGIAKVEGNCAMDALDTFFKDKENSGRRLTGLVAIYEELKPYRKTERVIIHESND